jgi:hypothetical protein
MPLGIATTSNASPADTVAAYHAYTEGRQSIRNGQNGPTISAEATGVEVRTLLQNFANGQSDQRIEDALIDAQLAQITTGGNSQQSRVPKLSDPDYFDGTRAKFTRFMTKLTLIFNADPARYQGDAAKIAYAASYLSGSAADWFEPHLDKNTGKVGFDTYADFAQALKNAYDDPDARTTAERKLHALRQGDRDCSTYHSEFATYATTLGYDDRTKISFFINGANHGLQTALSYQASTPEVFDEFIKLCIKLDNKARLLRAPKKPTPAASSTAPVPSTSFGTTPGPMDLSRIDKTSKKRGPLTEAQRRYRIDNHLCLYCGCEGHYASECPHSHKKKRLNAASESAPGAEQAPLAEITKN